MTLISPSIPSFYLGKTMASFQSCAIETEDKKDIKGKYDGDKEVNDTNWGMRCLLQVLMPLQIAMRRLPSLF